MLPCIKRKNNLSELTEKEKQFGDMERFFFFFLVYR